MAVTISNVVSKGKITIGTWTHTAGTANETFTVLGKVYACIIATSDASNEYDVGIKYSESMDTTTGVNTVTIQYQGDVTEGRLFVFSSMG